jgi:hypothetical protein
MRTPAGTDCRFYYADFYRGKTTQECRLLAANPATKPWQPGDCAHCPLPRLQLANACPNLLFRARIAEGLFGLTRRVEIEAACKEYRVDVPEPMVGCGHCQEYHRSSD